MRHPSAKCLSFLGIAAFAALSGCAVGPDFVAPAAPDVDRFTHEKIGVVQGGSGPGTAPVERLAFGTEIPQRWWGLFHSKALDELVASSVANNPTIDAAEAAIRVAYHLAEAQKGQFLPQLSASAGPSRNLVSNNTSVSGILQQNAFQLAANPSPMTTAFNTPYTLWSAQLNVSYVIDVWGQNRRAVEALEAQTDQQRYQLEAAYLVLTSNIAIAAIQEASLRGQISAVERVIAIERDLLGIARQQQERGLIALSDVLAQEAALAQALSLLPPLQKQLGITRNLLTALAGRLAPDEISQTFQLRSFTLPAVLPVSLPSKLVQQRPDVRAAEANLHAASAEVGVAIATRLPNLSISGNRGASAYDLAQMFLPGTNFYTIAAAAAQPLFSGVALLNRQRSTEEALKQANAQYRQAVVTAFQNVADALRSLQADTRAVKATTYAESTALKSLNIVREQFSKGAVNQLTVLNAQQTYLIAAVNRVQAEGNRLADVAGLFMALGGGWKDIGLRDQPAEGTSSNDAPPIQGPVNKSWFPSF